MRFTCEKSTLVSAISVASRTVAQKSTLPAIEGIYCQASLDLQLTGYNLETAITVSAQADIQEQGACILPARLLFDIIRRLPEGPVSVRVDDHYKVNIRAGFSNFNISASNAEDYPELPDVESRNGVSIPQSALREMISGTIFAVSENQSRPIHTGCLFEVDETTISVVAVDGYRLARRTYHLKEPTGRTMQFVVPAAALKEVEKILGEEDTVTFTLGPKHILFEMGNATLICRLLEGDFLDWRRVVPTDCPVKLTANVDDLAVTIDRVGLIVTEKLKSPVRCLFGDNVATFRTTTAIGAAEDQCAIAGNGEELEIGFNCRYLADALRAIPSQLTGYNLETAITVSAQADIQEQGACILPARLLFDIIRRLPEGPVSVRVDDHYKVNIRAGFSNFNISASNAEDYPELPDVESRNGVSIPQSALREMISGTIFAVSENQSRPIHTGCLFEVDETTISVVAVDGYRLARRTYHLKEPTGRTMQFVVPAAALKEVEKILGEEDTVTFTLGPKHILFEMGNATLICRLLEGDFLDWRRVVPTDCPVKLTANVDDLAVTIDRVGLIVTEKLKSPVRCLFGDNVATFRTTTAIGAAEDQCAIAGNGEELEIGFNCRYLADALRAIPSQEVCLELKNGLSPIVFTPVREEDDFAYMVLPVRLRAN